MILELLSPRFEAKIKILRMKRENREVEKGTKVKKWRRKRKKKKKKRRRKGGREKIANEVHEVEGI